MSDIDNLPPRRRLNAMVHLLATSSGKTHPQVWQEIGRRYKRRHHMSLWYMRRSYCEDHNVEMTMQAFLETTGRLDQAIGIVRELSEENG